MYSGLLQAKINQILILSLHYVLEISILYVIVLYGAEGMVQKRHVNLIDRR